MHTQRAPGKWGDWEGERRERGKKLKTIWVKYERNFKFQLCTIPCIIKETCLNSTTGVTEALAKDHGQRSAPHTAGLHIPLRNYWESLKLPRKSKSTKKVWKTMFSKAHHTSHHSEPWLLLKVLGFPGEMTKVEPRLQALKGSKPIQTWWDAEGSTTRDAICTENPTSCQSVRKYHGRAWDKRPDLPYFGRRSKGNEAFKKEHFLAGAVTCQACGRSWDICRDRGFSVLVSARLTSCLHLHTSAPHQQVPWHSRVNWQLRIRRK